MKKRVVDSAQKLFRYCRIEIAAIIWRIFRIFLGISKFLCIYRTISLGIPTDVTHNPLFFRGTVVGKHCSSEWYGGSELSIWACLCGAILIPHLMSISFLCTIILYSIYETHRFRNLPVVCTKLQFLLKPEIQNCCLLETSILHAKHCFSHCSNTFQIPPRTRT